MTNRIRWHHVDGTVVEWFGFVGTATPTVLFQILHPVAKPADARAGTRFDEWALCTTLPGPSEPRYGGRDEGSQDRLKAEAERWLEELVASLGASFPEDEIGDDEEPEPDWRFEWELITRDGNGNAVLKHKSTGGRYRIIPEEDL